jgi:aminoglycoside phosphotransferase
MVLMEELPAGLHRMIGSAERQQVLIGCSGVQVYRVASFGYLKVASDHNDLRPERDRLVWLEGRLPSPQMLYFGEHGAHQFMLISALPGLPAHDEHFTDRPRHVVTLLAHGLRTIHGVDIAGCPFDQHLDTLMGTAHANFTGNRVREDDFDTQHWGRTARDLYDELVATRPAEGALVFAHGDYCLPNVLIDPDRMVITGYIDWGSAGISDPYP